MGVQQWSAARWRWESSSGAGADEAFQDGPLSNGTQPTLWSGGNQTDATMMFAPAPPPGGGLYSFDGTLEIITSGTASGVRGQVVHYDAGGSPYVLYSFTSGTDTGNQSLDLGAYAGLQNIMVLPGEHLGVGFRKVLSAGEATALLYGSDPLTITGEVVPEPSTIALIGLAMAIGIRPRRSGDVDADAHGTV